MQRRPLLQQCNKFRLHVLVVIRHIQADHALALEWALEALRQLAAVLLFHHEDHFRPLRLFGLQWADGVRRQARRIGFYAGPGGEHALRRWAAEAVPATDGDHSKHGEMIGRAVTGECTQAYSARLVGQKKSATRMDSM